MTQYRRVPTKQFRKDLRRLNKAGYDLKKLARVIDRLAAGEPLSTTQRDHELQGSLAGIRECHVAPDWLLLYQRDRRRLILLLVRTGTHARLFTE